MVYSYLINEAAPTSGRHRGVMPQIYEENDKPPPFPLLNFVNHPHNSSLGPDPSTKFLELL